MKKFEKKIEGVIGPEGSLSAEEYNNLGDEINNLFLLNDFDFKEYDKTQLYKVIHHMNMSNRLYKIDEKDIVSELYGDDQIISLTNGKKNENPIINDGSFVFFIPQKDITPKYIRFKNLEYGISYKVQFEEGDFFRKDKIYFLLFQKEEDFKCIVKDLTHTKRLNDLESKIISNMKTTKSKVEVDIAENKKEIDDNLKNTNNNLKDIIDKIDFHIKKVTHRYEYEWFYNRFFQIGTFLPVISIYYYKHFTSNLWDIIDNLNNYPFFKFQCGSSRNIDLESLKNEAVKNMKWIGSLGLGHTSKSLRDEYLSGKVIRFIKEENFFAHTHKINYVFEERSGHSSMRVNAARITGYHAQLGDAIKESQQADPLPNRFEIPTLVVNDNILNYNRDFDIDETWLDRFFMRTLTRMGLTIPIATISKMADFLGKYKGYVPKNINEPEKAEVVSINRDTLREIDMLRGIL